MKTKWSVDKLLQIRINPRFRKIFHRGGILVGGLFLIFQFYKAIHNNNWSNQIFIQPINFIWALLVFLFIRLFQMVGWKLLMTCFNVNVTWLEILKNYTLSLLPRYIPGSVWGYVSRAEWLRKYNNTPYWLTNFSSLVEIALGLVGLALYCVIHEFSENTGFIKFALFIGGFMILIIPWYLLQGLLKSTQFKAIFRIDEYVISKFKTKFIYFELVIIIYTLSWMLFGVGIYFLSNSMGIINNINIFDYSFIYSIAWLVGFLIIIIPSGLGVRESIYSLLLVQWGSMSSGNAATIAIMTRIFISAGEVFFILIGLLIRNQKTINMQTNQKKAGDTP